jgi:hypothetical protein
MDFNVGDEVITAKGLWHNGQDIGGRLGKILSTEGHILVEVYQYENNPVKCFRYEVEKKVKGQLFTYKDVTEPDFF